jgi:hypothetical protein
MKDVLVGKSIKSDALRISRAVVLLEDLERALEEGFLLAAAPPVPAPVAPPIAGEPAADPDQGELEGLRRQIFRMADTAEISSCLVSFLKELVGSLLANHPFLPAPWINVQISRPEKRRIAVGDWVGYKGGGQRLTKQIGQEAGLGRVVGVDKLSRPRIRWNDGYVWKKPYSLFEESAVHVLFDYQAAAEYPSAFKTYPAEGQAARKGPRSQQLTRRAVPTKKTIAKAVVGYGPLLQQLASMPDAAAC